MVELFTSEGCSFCPPADKWASSLKAGDAVTQTFQVGHWDHIGWANQFAAPAYTQRQRDSTARNNLRSIHTPQVVLDGKDWPRWGNLPESEESARITITLRQLGANQFEASVTPLSPSTSWSAYWTVTEHGHNSRVLSGEKKGEFSKHDFVVCQLVQAGQYKAGDPAAQKLTLRSIATTPGLPRQVNLVARDGKPCETLQAASLQFAG